MSGSAASRPPEATSYPGAAGSPDPRSRRHEPIALVDLLDRVLAGGVVIVGDVRLSIADVDLVTISLQALISSVSALAPGPGDPAS